MSKEEQCVVCDRPVLDCKCHLTEGDKYLIERTLAKYKVELTEKATKELETLKDKRKNPPKKEIGEMWPMSNEMIYEVIVVGMINQWDKVIALINEESQ